MKNEICLFAAAAVSFTAVGTTTAFAGQWVQDQSRPAAENGVSNWRWLEDDGVSYASRCQLLLDGNGDGIYERYAFNEDGWMLADTVNEYGIRIDGNGAQLEEDGQVYQVIAPAETTVIDAGDYTLTLPETWRGHFCYSAGEDVLTVDFYPIKRMEIGGQLYDTVAQELFYIRKFDSQEEMEEERAMGIYDNWRELGSRDGACYVSYTSTDTAIGFFTEEEREQMENMRRDYDSNGEYRLWSWMSFSP